MATLPSLLCAQEVESDSLQKELQEVEITATRATEVTPIAHTNIGKEQLSRLNTGVDFPYLVSTTPSVVVTSDAGTGIGYTSLRIRGTDGTRINVTANGIPINDAESHNVFWVNMPDIASSVKDIQIQRGAGTSTNGAGSFGASINLKTDGGNIQPYATISSSYGSFNTHKATLNIGSGVLNDHWAVDARLSSIGSDGYIERAATELQSFYLQGAYYGHNTSVRLVAFGGKEQTYHAWNYASKEEIELYGRRYNSCGYMFTDSTGTARYYDGQTDNYTQINTQLLVDHDFTKNLKLSLGLHYTKGDGYYQEYKGNRKLREYALQPFFSNGTEITKSDLVRKKAMDNHFGGAVFALTYSNDRITAIVGGGANRYYGDHFGQVLWVKEYLGDLHPNHEYYRNNGAKNDANIYVRADYRPIGRVNIYADIQYRHIDYRIDGHNDKWDNATGTNQQLAIDEKFDFVNPKAGISWIPNKKNRVFASVGIAHKEPTRNNYTDGKQHEHPTAERLIDYEAGYTYTGKFFTAGANIYIMDYKDQLVLTGELNEIGEPLAANIPDSYRAGIELSAGINLPCGFAWGANATFSRNRIKNFTEVLYDDDSGDKWEIQHNDTPIAFSPDIVANNSFSYQTKGFEATLHSQYIGRQYMSNYGIKEHILDAYFVTNLRVSYSFRLKGIKRMSVGATIYNLFDEEYENNGYAGSGYYTTSDGTRNRYNYAGYAAQAGVNVIGNINIEL